MELAGHMGDAVANRRTHPITSFLSTNIMTIQQFFTDTTAPFSFSFRPYDSWTAANLNELLESVASSTNAADIDAIIQLNRYAEALLIEVGAVEGYRAHIVSTDPRHTVPPCAADLSLFAAWTRDDVKKARTIVRDATVAPVARQFAADQFAALYTALHYEIRVQLTKAQEPGGAYLAIALAF
jgi:hypothetical protein